MALFGIFRRLFRGTSESPSVRRTTPPDIDMREPNEAQDGVLNPIPLIEFEPEAFSPESPLPTKVESDSPHPVPDSEEPTRRKRGVKLQKQTMSTLQASVQTLREALDRHVLGQQDAVRMVINAMIGNWVFMPTVQDGPRGGPLAVLLFVGPNGNGKRLTAKTLCDAMTDYKLLTLDLAQIAHHSQTSLLVGDEPSFQNAAPGTMTQFVARHPKTLVLFENIERCHPLVLARLNTVLTTGQLDDMFGLDRKGGASKGSTIPVDFSHTVLVFSTSAGASVYEQPFFEALMKTHPSHAENMLLDDLANMGSAILDQNNGLQFTATMINAWRGGRTALFRELGQEALLALAQRGFDKLAQRLTANLSVPIDHRSDVLNDVLLAVLLSLAPRVGANEAYEAVPNAVFGPLLRIISETSWEPKVVTIGMGPTAAGQWQDLIQRVSQREGASGLLAQFKRRGLKVDITWEIVEQEHECKLQISHLQANQVKSGSDLEGPGAVKVEVPEVGFDKIAGHMLVKSRMAEVIRLLAQAHTPEGRALIPTGMLLYGPPGTGKTMLAKALAHEADLPFISTTGTELLDIKLTQRIFARARRYAPAIVFIDEVDALGLREKAAVAQVAAINQLLSEMDGFDSGGNGLVFVIAATNYQDQVDPALKRPGRLDLHLEVPALDPPARAHFIDKIFLLPLAQDVQREDLVRVTSGMSGAELQKLQRELQLQYKRQSPAPLSLRTVMETLNAQRFGERTSRNLSDQYRANIAIHEAGHAVIQRVLNPEHAITQISIVQRAGVGGFVQSDGESMANHRFTLKEVKEMICILLAGRAAQEKHAPGSADEGAVDDLRKATVLALKAVGEWGLIPEVGLLSFRLDSSNAYQQAIAQEQAQAARRLLDESYQECRALIDIHWVRIQALQLRLLQEETVLSQDW